jgi:hypothetical protein
MIGEKKNKSCPPRSIFITFLLGCCVFSYIEHCSSALNTNDSTSISNTSTAISSSTSNWDRTVFTGLGTAASSSDQEEKNLRVPTNSDNQEPTRKENRKSNKHSKITESAPEEEQNTILLRQQGILVMVMGEACNYHRWHLLWNSFLMHETKMESATSTPFAMKDNRVWSQSTTSSLHYPNVTNQEYQSKSNSFFVYASYDEPVSAANVSLGSCTSAGDNGAMDKHKCCNCSYNATNTSSSTIFIPGTTWTQGRNKLIEEALHLERRFGQKYDYWLFLDDDAVFKCRNGRGVMKNITNCNDICWNEFMNVLKDRSLVPEKATTVTLNMGRKSKQHYAASNADAMVAAFKREYVPYLLPYATLNVGESQWTSQAVLFCVMWSCFKQSTYFIPNIRVRNKAHRPYERGWNMYSFQAATARNYDQYMPLHRGCDESKHYEQMSDVVYASSVKELDDLIPAMNQSCTVLKQHFSDWAVQTVGLTAT